MKNKGWNIALAIMWGFCLIINIGLCATGGTPSWTHIICADILIICHYLDRAFFN